MVHPGRIAQADAGTPFIFKGPLGQALRAQSCPLRPVRMLPRSSLSEPPANVMPLDKVIDGMKAHLSSVTIHHERGDQAKWLRELTSVHDQLRTTRERAVEEVVGPVIRRLSRKWTRRASPSSPSSPTQIAPPCGKCSGAARRSFTASQGRSIGICPRHRRSKPTSTRWKSGSPISGRAAEGRMMISWGKPSASRRRSRRRPPSAGLAARNAPPRVRGRTGASP
jgi:hypothetical protein